MNFDIEIYKKLFFVKCTKCKTIEYGQTAHNRTVTVRRLSAARLRKTAVGLTPFMRFFSATFGAGVVAPQRPITCPKRQLQPKRYMPFF
jgi:hypothetical protein